MEYSDDQTATHHRLDGGPVGRRVGRNSLGGTVMPGYKEGRAPNIATVSKLRECFVLDPSTGVLVWRTRPREHFPSERGYKNFNKQFAGKPAGAKGPDGYLRVTLFGRLVLSHRVVFAMTHGRWPEDEIDHINRVRDDNRPENLRVAGPRRNAANHGVSAANTSGATGVSWAKHANKWRAVIRHEGQTRHLGYFSELQAAQSTYERVAVRLRGDFAREEFRHELD